MEIQWQEGALRVMQSIQLVNCTHRLIGEFMQIQGNASLNFSSEDFFNQTMLDWDTLRMYCDRERLKVGAQAASLGVIILSSLLANVLVLVVFYHRPSLLTISNRFVLNLAISNLLITLVVMPFAFASAMLGQSWQVQVEGCYVVSTATTMLFAACIYTLLLISIDRLYAIKRPLHYSMKITRMRSVFYIAGVWVVALAVAVPPLFVHEGITYQPNKGLCSTNWGLPKLHMKTYAYSFVGLCFIMPFAAMFWVYVTIFRAVQKTSAMARRNSVTPDSNDVSATQRMLAPPPVQGRRRSSVISLALFQIASMTRRQSSNASRISFHREDWRAAKTGIIVMFTFTLCWFPIFMVIALEAGLPADLEAAIIPTSFQAIAVWLSFLVCALNPMVYVFRTRAFKHELFVLLGRKPNGQNGLILIREPPGTPSCNMSKTSSATTFTRILTPRPSCDISEMNGCSKMSSGGITMKTLMVERADEGFVAKVRSSVPL
jgi:hypothetical protein